MNKSSITKRVSLKKSSEEIINRGDCCVIEQLSYNTDNIKPHLALVMRCPVCRMDMASVSKNKISIKLSWIRKIFKLPPKISVTPYLQCPYNPTHKFLIKNNKIKYIK